MEPIIKINLKEEYKREILGLGEIYEILSVNKKRLFLKRRFDNGYLFLSSNKDHSGRGFTLRDLREKIQKTPKKILDYGYVDCPPWQSSPRAIGKVNKIVYNRPIVFFIKFIFNILVFFEPFFVKSKTAHMIYVLTD